MNNTIETASKQGNIVYAYDDPDKLNKVIYEEAKRRGLFNGSQEEFWDMQNALYREGNRVYDESMGDIQESGLTKREIYSFVQTIGIDLPSILKLLGKEEINRLRRLEKARFVFLGCAGDVSAAEFNKISKKLNSNSEEILTNLQHEELKTIDKSRGQLLVRGDVFNLPYKEDTADLICTDHLLVRLLKMGKVGDKDRPEIVKVSTTDENIQRVLGESYKILKPGGSLIMVEQLFGEAKEQYLKRKQAPTFEIMEINRGSLRKKMEDQVRKLAGAVGFSQVIFSDYYSYCFRADSASAKIEEDGTPDYGEVLVQRDDKIYLVARLVK